MVHAAGRADSADLALPVDCPVGVLLPEIVDLVLGAHEHPPGPTRWVLTRPGGSLIDPSITLHDNAVRDGDLLVLTDVPPPPPRIVPGDPFGVATASTHAGAPVSGSVATAAATSVALLFLAVVLIWAGRGAAAETAWWVSAGVSATSAVTAAAAQHVSTGLREALAAGAIVHAAVTGAFVAAGPTWEVNVALASGAGLAMAVTLSRVVSGSTVVTVGCAAAAGASLMTAAVATATGCGLGAAGALLTVGSVAALSVAPTVTVMTAGLGPPRAPDARRVQSAQHLLTGLILGWAATTAVGVALTSADPEVGTRAAVAFAMVVSTLLILRRRVHCVAIRRIGLGSAGFATLGTALVTGLAAAPAMAAWWCGISAAVGAAGLWMHLRPASSNPAVQRGITVIEHGASAAVIPLAAWVAAGHTLVDGLGLP
jgi:type VII secretion integral membrane protein EccD